MIKRITNRKQAKKSDIASASVNSDAEENAVEDRKQPANSRPAKPPGNKKKKKPAELPESQVTCQMGTFHRLWRVLGLVLMLALNFGVLGSAIFAAFPSLRSPTLHSSSLHFSWPREAISLAMLAALNALVLFPILFEAWFVKADKENIELRSLFWRDSKKWEAVTEFKNPSYLKIALLRTGLGLYLLNKRALPNYALLEGLISRHVRIPKKNSKA